MFTPENKPFNRKTFETLPKKQLSPGRLANATLWILEHEGTTLVVKDFRPTVWSVRWTIGLTLIWHEYRILKQLQGLEGIPSGLFRIDALALGYRWIPGETLRHLPEGQVREDFFDELKEIVRAMHARGCVHLDMRNRRNVLRTEDGHPALIDFQSALRTTLLPPFLRRWLEQVDLSGVYKHWALHAPDSLNEEARQFLRWQLKMRRWWPFRGYKLPGAPQRPLYSFEEELLNGSASDDPGKRRDKGLNDTGSGE